MIGDTSEPPYIDFMENRIDYLLEEYGITETLRIYTAALLNKIYVGTDEEGVVVKGFGEPDGAGSVAMYASLPVLN